MKVLYERCCGMDVHKKSISACAITPEGKEIRTFGTMTGDLFELSNWIQEKGCTHVAMESTGVYWKPIYNVLELSEIQIMVINAQHIKAVPGRKTDVKDAEWIADLLRHGLLRASFIPDREQRELRELVRYRRSIIQERAREVNRVQKVLEGANIKLSSVATDVFGKSGRKMITALIQNETDPEELADLALGSLKKKKDDLIKALNGLMGKHQRMILSAQFQHIQYLELLVDELDREVEKRLRPFEKEVELLDGIPGVGRQTAELILAEIGVDMNRFPTEHHLAAWAGLAPGNNQSAGKRGYQRTRKGNKFLRSALVESARALASKKDTFLADKYHRIAARRGSKRASVAIAHKILMSAYYILKYKQPYKELGSTYLDDRQKELIAHKAVQRLEKLGFEVTIHKPVA